MKMIPTVLAVLLSTGVALGGQLDVAINPAEKVKKVQAIRRGASAIMQIKQDVFDVKRAGEDGHFIVEDLAPGVYDIYIETDDHTIEGVDLNVRPEKDTPVFHWWLPADRITTDNFDPESVFEEGVKVTEDEKTEAVRRRFRLDSLRQCLDALGKVKRFENFIRFIYASGTDSSVKALVELRRDGGHYAERGAETIWRAEVWQFTWNGTWSAQNRGAKVLERRRMQTADFLKFEKLYDPAIGGIEVKDKEPAAVTYTLPDVLDERMGKARKTEQGKGD